MQGILGRGDSQLCLGLNNAADGSLRLARRVKINEIKRFLSIKIGDNLIISAYLYNRFRKIIYNLVSH